jgi:hypothetical protein
MKQVPVGDKIVQTPWLRIDEAAAYCGLSRSAFDDRSIRLPHAGDDRMRLYHVETLDRWLRGEIADAPFTVVARKTTNPRRRRLTSADVGPMVFYDPVNGKTYPTKGGQ